MGACSIIAQISRWSYFIIALLSVMNSFIHLHIQFEMSQCPDAFIQEMQNYGYDTNSASIYIDSTINCIGRNLAWKEEDDFNFDTNKLFWRQTFSLKPEVFFDVWPPVIISIIALLQHFDTFKWDRISGDWGRCLLFIVCWQLFTVIGYGSNFGVVIGFLGLCWVAILYLIMCILLVFDLVEVEIPDKPVLDLMEYFAVCYSMSDNIKKRRNLDVKNDEQEALAPSQSQQQQHMSHNTTKISVNTSREIEEELKFPENTIDREYVKENNYGSGGWLPDQKAIAQWRSALIEEVQNEEKEEEKLSDPVDTFKKLIEYDPILKQGVQKMWQECAILHPEIPSTVIPDPDTMYKCINKIIQDGPKWYGKDLIGVPLAALFTGVNATFSGQIVFRNELFNLGLTLILKHWNEKVLNKQLSFPEHNSWLSDDARKKWESTDGIPTPGMWEYVLSEDPYWPSWNSFFTRHFSKDYYAKNRAIAQPGNDNVIVSPNDGSAFRWRENIKPSDTFWLKDMPYSLNDIFGDKHKKEYASRFAGGKIFQTFLNPFNYHRWNAPVQGKVVLAEVLPGYYFSKLVIPDIEGGTTASCPYLTEVNARGLVIIDTEGYANIGYVCAVPIGMVEVSSIKLTVEKGQNVKKGQEIGYFEFGGSSFAIIFEDTLKKEYNKKLTFKADRKIYKDSNLFPKDAPPPSPNGAGIAVNVNSQIAILRYSK